MAKESKGEVGLATHAGEAVVQGPRSAVSSAAHTLASSRTLTLPTPVRWVQLRGVAWQAFDVQPAALARQIRAHGAARVRAQAVPDQDHRTAAEVPFQVRRNLMRVPAE